MVTLEGELSGLHSHRGLPRELNVSAEQPRASYDILKEEAVEVAEARLLRLFPPVPRLPQVPLRDPSAGARATESLVWNVICVSEHPPAC